MKYQLVLQFPGESIDDFDRLVELEDKLVRVLGRSHDVDGHDFGSGEMNIFVITETPEAAFIMAKEVLTVDMLSNLKAAFRRLDSDEFQNLWPEGSSEAFSVL